MVPDKPDYANTFITAPGTDAFERWRPRSRVVAPVGWLNDPCAPFWDEKTGLYHLFYQCESDCAGAGKRPDLILSLTIRESQGEPSCSTGLRLDWPTVLILPTGD